MRQFVTVELTETVGIDLAFHYERGELVIDKADGIDPAMIPQLFPSFALEAMREESETAGLGVKK
jgi:hypothetical protein